MSLETQTNSVTLLNIISIVSSVIMLIGFVLFLIFVIGRPNSKIHKLQEWQQWVVRFALCLCSMGSFLNILYYNSQPPSDLCLHIGISSLMIWASWFHYTTFVTPITIKKSIIKPIKNKKKRQ